jgi:hypothetical protein
MYVFFHHFAIYQHPFLHFLSLNNLINCQKRLLAFKWQTDRFSLGAGFGWIESDVTKKRNTIIANLYRETEHERTD